jgi:hypothetical protein
MRRAALALIAVALVAPAAAMAGPFGDPAVFEELSGRRDVVPYGHAPALLPTGEACLQDWPGSLFCAALVLLPGTEATYEVYIDVRDGEHTVGLELLDAVPEPFGARVEFLGGNADPVQLCGPRAEVLVPDGALGFFLELAPDPDCGAGVPTEGVVLAEFR